MRGPTGEAARGEAGWSDEVLVVMQSGPTLAPSPSLLDDVTSARAAVERRLAELLPERADATPVDRAMREAVLGPGKRLRPLLVVLGAQDLGWSGASVDAGCALELVHAASLVLDDLPSMDDAATRRGRPAVHVTFGEDVATLASIALLARAYGVLAAAPGLSAEQRIEAVAILSEAVGSEGLVGGQFEDLHSGHACADRARAINDRKTSALFVAATRMACVLAGSPAACRDSFTDFAVQLGQAFQILDDLLDVEGNPSLMGKPNGQDVHKPNLVRLLGAAAGRAQLGQCVTAAKAALSRLPNGGGRVACLLEMTFGLEPGRMAGAGPELRQRSG